MFTLWFWLGTIYLIKFFKYFAFLIDKNHNESKVDIKIYFYQSFDVLVVKAHDPRVVSSKFKPLYCYIEWKIANALRKKK